MYLRLVLYSRLGSMFISQSRIWILPGWILWYTIELLKWPDKKWFNYISEACNIKTTQLSTAQTYWETRTLEEKNGSSSRLVLTRIYTLPNGGVSKNKFDGCNMRYKTLSKLSINNFTIHVCKVVLLHCSRNTSNLNM